MNPSFLLRTRVPLPSDDNPLAEGPMVPIHTVTVPSQLPQEFLYPSQEKELIIGLDCEGVNLSSVGPLCTMQLSFEDGIFVVDPILGGEELMKACKPALESTRVKKVIHDCKRDSEALYFQFGIKLTNVMDSQLAYALIEELEGRARACDIYISLVGLLKDKKYCGVPYTEKDVVKKLLEEDPNYWSTRPMTEYMLHRCADDVRFLLYMYPRLIAKLNNRYTWYLDVRSALRCRCFCINNTDFADWPSLPPMPDAVKAEENPPEPEVLCVVDVLPGKMGYIIGKNGNCIRSTRKHFRAEIHLLGEKGEPGQVFIIGALQEVSKVEIYMKIQGGSRFSEWKRSSELCKRSAK